MERESQKKKMIEALLFATNDGFSVEEICNRVGLGKREALKLLKVLKKEYDEKEGAIEVIEEKGKWRMKIKPEVSPVIKDLLPVEIPKQVLKTLAVIAWKSPAKQSEVIKIRGNKAYNHIKELIEQEYITATKKGRTKILRLGPKFYKYFDLSRKDAKKLLSIEKENIDK